MESNSQNQGYWFVVREDQGNVIFSSNNIALQNSQIAEQEPRYIIETGGRHFTQLAEPTALHDDSQASAKSTIHHPIKNESFWDRIKIRLLLSLCLEKKNIDQDTAWEEISRIIGASPEDCHNKYRHLRRTYLRILKKTKLGKETKWPHYNICEEVFTDLRALPPSVLEPWDDAKVRRMLSLYIDNLPRFRNPNSLQKDVWREIASQLGSTRYNCYHKFRNLKRSYLNCLNRSRETGKRIKWPYQQYFEKIYYNYSPDSRSWDKYKIKLLIDAYTQVAHQFRDPKIQKKELWREISVKVGETPAACDKKFRNLKQTYERLKMKNNCVRSNHKWRYYRDFDAIFSNTTRYIDIDGSQRIVYRNSPEKNYVHQLLEFYLAHKEKFCNPLTKKRALWKIIAPKVGLTPDECNKKFRNLKQTYVRLAWRKKQTGKDISWPYFPYFEKIFEGEVEELPPKGDIQDVMRIEIQRALNNVTERRECNQRFEQLMHLTEESNQIQRDRNRILQALLDRK